MEGDLDIKWVKFCPFYNYLGLIVFLTKHGSGLGMRLVEQHVQRQV